MTTESIAFALVVAVVGVTVVFLFLSMLSGLMLVIRGADHLLPGRIRGRRRESDALTDVDTVATVVARRAEVDWVLAAAVTYLDLEERDGIPDAAPWTAGRPGQSDLWYVGKRGG